MARRADDVEEAVAEDIEGAVAQAREAGRRRFGALPEGVALEDTVAEHDARPVADPQGGRDPERDFLLRHALP